MFNTFLDFCYIARKSALTEDDLGALSTVLQRFHHYHTVFWDTGIQPEGFSLPRQHALVHYQNHIQNFGTPNGLCSSITESKHIAAVKKPWRQSSRYNALQQMLVTNTRNNQLVAAQVDFLLRGMLEGTCLGEMLHVPSGDQDDADEDTIEGTISDSNEEDSDDWGNRGRDSSGPVDRPPILGEVTLALKKGTSIHLLQVVYN